VAASNYDEAFLQRAIEEAPRETAPAAPAPQPRAVAMAPAPAVAPAAAPAPALPRAGAGDGTLSPSEHWLMSLQPPAAPAPAAVPATFDADAAPVFADLLARGRDAG